MDASTNMVIQGDAARASPPFAASPAELFGGACRTPVSTYRTQSIGARLTSNLTGAHYPGWIIMQLAGPDQQSAAPGYFANTAASSALHVPSSIPTERLLDTHAEGTTSITEDPLNL